MSEKDRINQEIINLQASLSSNSSRIGDWAVMKCLEAKEKGEEIPYDLEQLMADRDNVRKRINELQDQLKDMPDDEQNA